MLLERWSQGATAVGCAATGARRRVAAAASVPWEADSVECKAWWRRRKPKSILPIGGRGDVRIHRCLLVPLPRCSEAERATSAGVVCPSFQKDSVGAPEKNWKMTRVKT